MTLCIPIAARVPVTVEGQQMSPGTVPTSLHGWWKLPALGTLYRAPCRARKSLSSSRLTKDEVVSVQRQDMRNH